MSLYLLGKQSFTVESIMMTSMSQDILVPNWCTGITGYGNGTVAAQSDGTVSIAEIENFNMILKTSGVKSAFNTDPFKMKKVKYNKPKEEKKWTPGEDCVF